MSLGQFVKTSNAVMKDAFQAQYAANNNKPLLVWVREYKTGIKTDFAKDGDGEGIVVDLIDLSTFNTDPEGSVKCNVLWMGSAVRDQLKPYVGSVQPYPIRLAWQTGGSFGKYIAPESLDESDPWFKYAVAIYDKYPTFVGDVRAKKEAAWKAEQEAAGVPQVAPAVPSIPSLSGPAPQAQAPAAAPPAPPQAQPPAAPPQAPQYQAPVAAPPAPPQAPQVQAPPAAPPQAPAAPPVPPQVPAMVAASAPGQLADQDVDQLLAQLKED